MDPKKEENTQDLSYRLKPLEPDEKLKNNEIGVKTDIKGFDIKKLLDKIIYLLIIKKLPNVTLKSRGKGIHKLISIQDILRRKVLGLYVIQKTYSNTYINEKDNNKQVRLPCLDIIFSIEEPVDKTEGFFYPLKKEELDKNYIDPQNPINFVMNSNNQRNGNYRGRYKAGFRGRGRGRGNYPNNRGRGNYWNNRGRGNYNNPRGRGNYNNNRGRGNYNNNRGNYNNYRGNNYRGNQRGNYGNYRGRFIRRGNYENFRREDEDYRGFKGGNRYNY